jgi:hypothetical protein
MTDYTTKFDLKNHLYIAQFISRSIGISDLKNIKDFKDVQEGIHTDGFSHMFHMLLARPGKTLREADLRNYDIHIQEYIVHINKNRPNKIHLKYFQYLAILLTEIYLDKYFIDPIQLVNEINDYYSQEVDKYKLFNDNNISKIAYWMATGSGKTILMHINLLQFKRYNKGIHKLDYDNILVITANDDMTEQHLDELALSNIDAEDFDGTKISYTFGNQEILKILSIHKLTEDKSGDGTTIDVEWFGKKNLVFVDEGHKGKASKNKETRVWQQRKEKITEKGFTFEYSATFAQIISSIDDENFNEYSESIIFDYSYKYFHQDGYGKNYKILNLDTKTEFDQQYIKNLLTANALSYLEQILVYENTPDLHEYNIEKPLWMFVGARVSGKNTQSDILTIIDFFNYLIKTERQEIISNIKQIMNGEKIIVDAQGKSLFDNTDPQRHFPYLKINYRNQEEQIYKEIMKKILYVDPDTTGKKLHFSDIKTGDGETGLRASSNTPYFGVVYISDNLKRQLRKEIEKKYFDITLENDVSSKSLFSSITETTDINILIGAKKFIEGWNSWRVSNLCLLNVGKSQGPQIIQLFGRGVRLKGKKYSLKRSHPGDDAPIHLPLLETLNIYGVKANYMKEFQKILETESIPVHRTEVKTKTLDPFPEDLQVLKIRKDWDFYDECFELEIDDKIKPVLDLRPVGFDFDSRGHHLSEADNITSELSLDPIVFNIIGYDDIYLDILRYKKLKEYYNIHISKQTLIDFFSQPNNYTIYRNEPLPFTIYSNYEIVQKIATQLFRKYVDLYYNSRKRASMAKNLQLIPLKEDDKNIDKEYTISVEGSDENLLDYILQLLNSQELYTSSKTIQLQEDLRAYVYSQPPNFRNSYYENHLYQPLLSNKNPKITIIPGSLNEGETKFIEDLVEFLSNDPYPEKEIYLLRNSTKSKGVGFYAEHRYYPDFIMWIKEENQQRVLFIDPKGLTHISFDPLADESKLYLFEHLQNEIQPQLKRTDVILDSYTVSVTDHSTVQNLADSRKTVDEFARENHILFQYTTKNKSATIVNPDYIQTLFDIVFSYTPQEGVI